MVKFSNTWKVKPMWKDSRIKPIPLTSQKPIPRNPNKNLSYPQAKKLYSGLSPFGNWDKDQVLNKFDCRPFDYRRHVVPEQHKDKHVQIYIKPGSTFGSVFSESEKRLPEHFTGIKDSRNEVKYSKLLSNSLLERMEVGSTPFKGLVGIYKVDVPPSIPHITMIHDFINRDYLTTAYPDYVFFFNIEQPNKVNVEIHKVDEEGKPYVKYVEGVKLGGYLKDAPDIIQQLNKLYTTNKSVTFYITDNPVDLMMRSTGVGWPSCETMPLEGKSGGSYYKGCFSDIANKNAIAWIYLGKEKVPGKSKPSGRILLRWGLSPSGKPEIGMEPLVYPKLLSKIYLNALREILVSKGYGLHKMKTTKSYLGSTQYPTSEGKISYPPPPKYDVPQFATEETIKGHKLDLIKARRLATPLAHQFAKDEQAVRAKLAGREDIGIPIKSKLSLDKDETIRRLIAQHKELPLYLVKRLAQDKPEIKSALLESQEKLPEYIIQDIAKDPSMYRKLAERKDTPTEILMKIAAEESDDYEVSRAKETLARRPNLPLTFIKLLLKTGNESVWEELASNQRSMPENILRELLEKSPDVRKSLATNPDLPSSIAVDLLKDQSWAVKREIIKNYGIPKPLAIHLARDESKTVRETIAESPILPKEVFDILSTDRSITVKEILAKHPGITSDAALHLSTQKGGSVPTTLIQNPLSNVSPEIKKQIFINFITQFRPDSVEIKMLAQRTDLPDEIIKSLRGQ